MLQLLLLIPLLVAAPRIGDAQTIDRVKTKADHLRLVKGFYISVAEVSQDAQALGIRSSDIRTAAELRLRSLGITVLNENDPEATGFLRIEVHIVCLTDKTTCAILPSATMKAGIIMSPPHNRSYSLAGVPDLSHIYALSIGGSETVKAAWREYLTAMIDSFANSWLSVHPK
jgi:hypothetical protein